MITKYVTNTYEITNTYNKLLINAKNASVTIEPSSNHSTKLVFFEDKKHPYIFSIENDTLTIEPAKKRWYNFLRIGMYCPKIRLGVPKSMLETLSTISNTGCVNISSITCNGTIDIQINTGKIHLESVLCQTFNSKGNTGHISLNKLTATERISIKRCTGNVSFNDCSAREIFVKTNTGNVHGKLPSTITFTIQTNTGRIEIPKAPIGKASSGRCEIKTNTGNIKFE